MFTVKLRGFHELETREFFHIGTLAIDANYTDANEFAQLCATELEPVAWILCRAHDCDGLSVDVCDGYDVVNVSYELIPGRPVTSYYGDECHE